MAYYRTRNLKFDPLTREQEVQLFTKMNAATTDRWRRHWRDKIIDHYLLFAAQVARAYSRNLVAEEEAVSAANVGLLSAIERFDPSRGVRFGSFAKKFLYGRVLNAISSSCRWNSIRDRDRGQEYDLTESVPEKVDRRVQVELLREAIKTLDVRMQYIVRSVGIEGRTLDETREGLGVCRERVRQLYREALGILRKWLPLDKCGILTGDDNTIQKQRMPARGLGNRPGRGGRCVPRRDGQLLKSAVPAHSMARENHKPNVRKSGDFPRSQKGNQHHTVRRGRCAGNQ